MKSDRRHELQTNELADWLGDRLEALKPQAAAITVGLIVLLAVVLGTIWYLGGEDAAAARNWSDYFGAFNKREPAEELEKLAAAKAGTTASLWAMQAVGDMSLSQGAALLFSDRAEAQKRLEKAKTAFQQVEAATSDQMLKDRARIGLAKVHESLCQPAEAVKYYEMVAKSQGDSAIGKAAEDDARRMKDQRQVELLAWFAQQTPKKPAPLPGMGGAIPGLPDLPAHPDIGAPGGLSPAAIGAGAPGDLPLSFPPPASTPPPPPTLPEGTKSDPAKTEPATTEPAKTEPTKDEARSDQLKEEEKKPEGPKTDSTKSEP
jgi:hypothetical protein